jgi:hypothetical protein
MIVHDAKSKGCRQAAIYAVTIFAACFRRGFGFPSWDVILPLP